MISTVNLIAREFVKSVENKGVRRPCRQVPFIATDNRSPTLPVSRTPQLNEIIQINAFLYYVYIMFTCVHVYKVDIA